MRLQHTFDGCEQWLAADHQDAFKGRLGRQSRSFANEQV